MALELCIAHRRFEPNIITTSGYTGLVQADGIAHGRDTEVGNRGDPLPEQFGGNGDGDPIDTPGTEHAGDQAAPTLEHQRADAAAGQCMEQRLHGKR